MNENNKFGKDEFSYLELGQEMPDFNWNNNSGENISSKSLRSKETILILFSETCPHCIEIFDFLKSEFSKMDLSAFNIYAIGRECNSSQLEAYAQQHLVSINTIPDPDRTIYSKFAEKVVPRIYYFDKKCLLLASIRGYKPQKLREFLKLIKA